MRIRSNRCDAAARTVVVAVLAAAVIVLAMLAGCAQEDPAERFYEFDPAAYFGGSPGIIGVVAECTVDAIDEDARTVTFSGMNPAVVDKTGMERMTLYCGSTPYNAYLIQQLQVGEKAYAQFSWPLGYTMDGQAGGTVVSERNKSVVLRSA